MLPPIAWCAGIWHSALYYPLLGPGPVACWYRLLVHHRFHIVLKTAEATLGGTRLLSFHILVRVRLAIQAGVCCLAVKCTSLPSCVLVRSQRAIFVRSLWTGHGACWCSSRR